jgi:ElaB/YqjD/DUF883 family membrane-anchored ribosome-binding protein
MVRIDNRVKARVADAIDTSLDRFSARLASPETQLRESGERVLANARDLGDVAGKQMRSHPQAAFGVAFMAGIAIARLLQR